LLEIKKTRNLHSPLTALPPTYYLEVKFIHEKEMYFYTLQMYFSLHDPLEVKFLKKHTQEKNIFVLSSTAVEIYCILYD